MINPVNTEFWQSPPWLGGGAKHQLGLSPVDAALTVTAIDEPMRVHKSALLDTRYADVVVNELARDATIEGLDAVCWPPQQRLDAAYPDFIANFAMRVKEDLCLIDIAKGQSLVAACVCAPSYWSLLRKAGRPLFEIHQPVQGLNAKLGRRIAHVMESLPAGRAFRRRNWFCHGDAEWFHVDEERELEMPVEDWVMRSEVQTLYRVNRRFVLFTIDIVCEPLAHIVEFPRARTALVNALGAMDAQEIEHFGGQAKHARLTGWLGPDSKRRRITS